MKWNYTLIDMMRDILDIVFTAKDKKTEPYDIVFTNYYKVLYNFEEHYFTITGSNLSAQKIIQDKAAKQLTVLTESMLDEVHFASIKEYCDDNGIHFVVNKMESGDVMLEEIVIDKHTKGVFEERKWKENV